MQFRPYGLVDCLELPLACATTNHEIVGHLRHWADVHEQDVLTQLADNEIYDRPAQFFCFQTLPPFLAVVPYSSNELVNTHPCFAYSLYYSRPRAQKTLSCRVFPPVRASSASAYRASKSGRMRDTG